MPPNYSEDFETGDYPVKKFWWSISRFVSLVSSLPVPSRAPLITLIKSVALEPPVNYSGQSR